MNLRSDVKGTLEIYRALPLVWCTLDGMYLKNQCLIGENTSVSIYNTLARKQSRSGSRLGGRIKRKIISRYDLDML